MPGTRRFPPPVYLIAGLLGLAVLPHALAEGESSVPAATLRPTILPGWANEWFGVDVDLSENLLVVGSDQYDRWDPGTVFIYRRSGSSWPLEATLSYSGQEPVGFPSNGRFGYDVAISDDEQFLFVGAHGAADGSHGSVHIYRHAPAGWQHETRLSAPDGQRLDRFGGPLAVSGDNLAVGAYRTDDAGFDSGSVYMFRRQADGGWTQVDKLTIPDARDSDLFGSQLAIEGDLLIATTAGADYNGNSNQGGVYTFARDPVGGSWPLVGRLTAEDGSAGDLFGSAVALSGDLLAVGAYGRAVPGREGPRPSQGSVYLYHRDPAQPSGWRFHQLLKAADGEAGAWFGRAVEIDGDTLLVGAAPFSGIGAAYAFTRDANGIAGNWRQVHKFLYPGAGTRPWFGDDVAISSHVVVVAAREDNGVAYKDGAVFLFDRTFDPTPLPHPVDQWRLEQFGSAPLLDPAQRDTLWGDRADPDRDRIPNWAEYLGGSPPLVADPPSRRPVATFSGSALSWTVPGGPGAAVMPYLWTNAGPDAWQRLGGTTPVSGETSQTLSVPNIDNGAPARLFRLHFEED